LKPFQASAAPKKAISESAQFQFRSNWNVLLLAIVSGIVFFMLAMVWLFGLLILGLIKLP